MSDTPFVKPNMLASQSEKKKDDFGIKFAKYIQGKSIGKDFEYFDNRKKRIRKARAYSQGDQDNSPYKERYNATGDSTPMNLSWDPLGIGSKFISSLVADMMQDFSFEVKAIDPASMSKRKAHRDKLLGFFYNKDFIEDFKEESGIDIAQGIQIPESLDEVQLHMNITYKQSIEIAMKQIIAYNLELNNYPDETRQLVIQDLVMGGMGVVKVEFDPSFGIRVRYVDIENFVFSDTVAPDMSDIAWAGEMRWMSIGDIKRLSGKQFTNNQLKKIYEKHKGRWDNDNFYDGSFKGQYNNSKDSFVLGYQYDTLVVPVLDFAFKAEDFDKIKVTKSKNGERRYLKPDTYEPKSESTNVKVEKDSYSSVYTGMYILGSDFIFNYGLMKNMVRPNKSLTEVELPYKVYAPKFYSMTNKSLMELIIPYIDNINLAHLKMQQVVARSHPEVTVIDLEGWMNLTINGQNLDPLDMQDVFDATGIVYTKSRGEDGQFIPDPVKTFANRVNIDPYISTINYNMQLIRETIGFTPEREGVTQNKQLVGTMELSIKNSRNSTQFIENAMHVITKRVCNDVAWRVQDLEKDSKFWERYEQAIGAADMAVLESMEGIPMADFGIFIDPKPTQEDLVALQQSIEREMGQGVLKSEDAAMVRKLAKQSGVDTAYQYMRVRRDKYLREAKAEADQKAQRDAVYQAQIAQSQANAEIQKAQAKTQLIVQEESARTEREIAVLREKFKLEKERDYELHLYKLEENKSLDQGQMGKEKYKEDRKDERVEKTAKVNATQQQEILKVRDGKKPEVDTGKIKSDGFNINEYMPNA